MCTPEGGSSPNLTANLVCSFSLQSLKHQNRCLWLLPSRPDQVRKDYDQEGQGINSSDKTAKNGSNRPSGFGPTNDPFAVTGKGQLPGLAQGGGSQIPL